MDEKTEKCYCASVGITTLLTIVFVILKLTNVITWSWWWVFSPTLFTIAIAIMTIIVVIVVLGISMICEW